MPDKHRPRKRFGQHFLHDPHVVDRIVNAISPRPDQTIVEIGPGQGVLTEPLAAACESLHAVEIDRDLYVRLSAYFEDSNVTLHNADALKINPCELVAGRIRIVGNLPYNISSPLLFHFFKHLACIEDMTFMLQKEVVDRMCAAPGSKTYGRLSVMVQYFCTVNSLFVVGPGAFTPPPRVDSAIVRLRPHATRPYCANDEPQFARIVLQAFSQRRKTLRNSLSELVDAAGFTATGIDSGRRAETLSVEEFVALANTENST